MTKTTKIYALIDPRDGHVRYVGKTLQAVEHRLATHISFARKKTQTYSARWISGLLSEGLRPEIATLDEVTDGWQEAESFWIAYLRSLGCLLTNHTLGGDGLNSYSHTELARLNMSAAQKKRFEGVDHHSKGIPRPLNIRQRIGLAQKGRVIGEEHRAKIAASLRGRTIPDDVKVKISEAGKLWIRKPMTQEQKDKIAAKARGRVQSAAANEKRSAALKGVPKSEEHRQRLSEAARRRYAKVIA